MKMERPAQRYFCNKCGYVGNVDLHSGCGYLAYHLAPFEQNYIDQLDRELALLKASPASAPEGCSPTLTECPRCHNDVKKCDGVFAAPTPPENKALLEAVAEVVWYDPQLSHFPEKPGKIIDGSIAFMESAEIGTKLFASPTPPVSEDRWLPIATAPKDRFVLLAGPSGYTTIETVFATGRMCSDYHVGRWIDHANDDLADWGFEPTRWMPLPKAPAMQEDKKP